MENVLNSIIDVKYNLSKNTSKERYRDCDEVKRCVDDVGDEDVCDDLDIEAS